MTRPTELPSIDPATDVTCTSDCVVPDELHGTLGEGGLVPLVHWLQSLEVSGRLRLWQADWTAELTLQGGQLIAASAGEMQAQPALEVIVLALGAGSFAFTPGPVACTLPPIVLAGELARVVARHAERPPMRPQLVPRLVEDFEDDPQASLALDYSALATLIAVDGQRSVAEIAARSGLHRAVVDLTQLWRSGVIAFDERPQLQTALPLVVQPRRLPRLPERSPWKRAAIVLVGVALLSMALFFGLAVVTQLNALGRAGPEPTAMPPAAPPESDTVAAVELAALAPAEPDVASPVSAQPTPRTLLVEQSAGFEIVASQPGHFVAIAAPIGEPRRDVIVRARLRKVDGPAGGGYGVIVRDQGFRASGDGQNENGDFYLFEVRDTGEVGAWRHQGPQWYDLMPWAPSTAVQPGTAANELQVRAEGKQLRLLVNGVEAISVVDPEPASGGVGVFVGGDANAVVLEQLAVEVP